jgi:hypothetical protein
MKLSIATYYPANTANYTKGRQGNAVDRITVHHTAGFESTLRHLYANPLRAGSAHFFVHPSYIEQYVDTADTAWTNGNFSSNLRAITIEVRGDWRGYYDQKTLDNLRKLFRELRLAHPNARITYHMDESTKATLCPADLKHKGYALKEWNASLTKEEEVFKTDEEVKEAYLLLRGSVGTQAERNAWIGQPKQRFFAVGKPEADSTRKQLADVKKALADLQNQPPKEVVKIVKEIVEVPVEKLTVKEVEIVKEVEKPATWQTVIDFIRNAINTFLRR